MKTGNPFPTQALLFTVASAIGVLLTVIWMRTETSLHAAPGPSPSATPNQEIAVLQAEVNRLKGIVGDQSHAMADVGYHFANLWFAGQKKNWPLAKFYLDETRSHLKWAVRIIPVRKDPKGNEIRLAEILDPIDKTALQQVGDAIKAQDNVRFGKAYRQMLDSCYSCHVAVGKPFLRLQIPQQPEVPIVRFEPEPRE